MEVISRQQREPKPPLSPSPTALQSPEDGSAARCAAVLHAHRHSPASGCQTRYSGGPCPVLQRGLQGEQAAWRHMVPTLPGPGVVL
eukprot:1160590-Pelagomonas_calceolata.AAC.16